MPEFDRAGVERYIATVGAFCPPVSFEVRMLMKACLTEIDRLTAELERKEDGRGLEYLTNTVRQSEQRGYRRGLENAAKCEPLLATDTDFRFQEGFEWGIERMQDAIRALLDTPQEEDGDGRIRPGGD
jgi:hypothetical protein